MKHQELSANAVTFINSRGRLIKVLAGATRRGKGSKGGEGRVRLLNANTSAKSTFDSLTWPPPPLLPFSPLAALANNLVNLPLQLMKATVLAESS